ncbi:MAG TPA: extracellular solute-binding protein [Candidatus Saccharimonadales bacterium]|nr:extracellular solute-binding protein [Candidatus Saccharimonadales bacterium]
MKRGVVIIIGVVLLVIVGIVAIVIGRSGSSTKSTTTTLKVWSPYDESKAWDALTAKYTTDNPNVKIEFKYVDATDAKDYEAKVVNAIAAGNGPDIWLIRNDWLPKHQTKLVPSTSYVKWSTSKSVTETQAINNLFGQNLAAQNSLDGQLYGYPISVDSLALYINQDVIRATENDLGNQNRSADSDTVGTTPTTWADVAKISQLITKKSGGTITRSGIALGTTGNTYAATDILSAMLAQYSGKLYTDDHKDVAINLANVTAGVSSFPGQQALGLFTSFATPGNANYTWNSSLGDPVQAFASNKLAMIIGYSTLANQIKAANKDLTDVKVVALPQVADLDLGGDPVDLAAYYTAVVPKTSANPKLAWQLLNSLGGSDLNAYAKESGRPVLSQTDLTNPNKKPSGNFGETTLFADQVAWAANLYQPEWQGVAATLQDSINQVLQGQSISTAIDNAAAGLKKLLP